MLDLAGSRWLDLVQILMDWIEHCRASHRLMRRHTPLRQDGGIGRTSSTAPICTTELQRMND
jgi:hypothetical protein